MTRTLIMSEKEIERIKVLQIVEEGRLTQKKAAQRLTISERHLRRILHDYRKQGDAAVISRHRGKASNNRMSAAKRAIILKLLQTTYEGFGPTLASEKLAQRDNIEVSKETVRTILIEEGIHRPKTRKREKAHPARQRRASYGELVQIDGSYHAWLEDRAPNACLLLMVDDATSQVLDGTFVPQETFFAYAQFCKSYFAERGLPQAFYSDKFSVFRVNAKNTTTTEAITQFGRALAELDIELICAETPQAKGRIERANRTFQDRLVKEMRLENIKSYQQANLFLPIYFQQYNRQFGVQPRSPLDFHRPVPANCNLDHILSWQSKRIISKDLQIQFEKTIYQIITDRPAYALRNREVLVAKHADGSITFLLNNHPLHVRVFHQQPKQAEVVSPKSVRHPNPPAFDHPWRTYGKKLNGKSIHSPD
jgi:transposase